MRVDDLASRLGFAVEDWEEEGLGPARGAAIALPSGRVFQLQELAHLVEHFGAPGPDVLMDATDVAAIGIPALCSEVLDALRLTPESVVWLQKSEAAAEAADCARWARTYLAEMARSAVEVDGWRKGLCR